MWGWSRRCFLVVVTRRLVRIKERRNGAEYIEVPKKKPALEHTQPQTEVKVHLTVQLQPKVSECPRVAQPKLWHISYRHLWSDRLSPSNLTELERIRPGEWEKVLKFRCAKLETTYPRKLKAGNADKVLSKGSEQWSKWENSVFSFLIGKKRGLLCHYGLLQVDWNQENKKCHAGVMVKIYG